VEKELCENADVILVCSEEEKYNFIHTYGIPYEKIEVFSNGADIDEIEPANSEVKAKCKSKLKILTNTAIFIGSDYPPNIEAANYIVDSLAKKCPNITFIIVGGVGNQLKKQNEHNIVITGPVDNDEKKMYINAADLAINPMELGSGTNIKMFDYLAAGLPTISTAFGARGINNSNAFIVADRENFAKTINYTLSNKNLLEQLSKNGRSLVENEYNWNKISQKLGNLINTIYLSKSPFFSVVIPTNRNNDYLLKLFEKLNKQLCKDFEVIVVDSGTDHGDEYQQLCNFKLRYLFRPEVGAARARNIGIHAVLGKFVAFTDDDCQPDDDWLKNAKKRLVNTDLCGLEGLIYTDEDKLNDSNYRIVTNKGFEGIGFMTANLIIKTEILRKISGFDIRFDKPHFREDTDLGWRAEEYGSIPFSKDVRVYHPPLLKKLNGKSCKDRDYFFINDAVLFSKFPQKYIRLMKAEGHFRNNKNFWKYFIEGCDIYHPDINLDYMLTDIEINQYIPDQLKVSYNKPL